MANRYAVAADVAATAGTADHVGALLWNPHGTKSIYVREVHVFSPAATVQAPSLVRTSTAGVTPTSTTTPDADNAFDRRAIPPSGALLYGATFGTQPTLQTPYLARSYLPAAIGAAVMWSFLDEPLEVPAGTGLAVATPIATALQANRVTYVWDE
jgi:hypothetical protein